MSSGVTLPHLTSSKSTPTLATAHQQDFTNVSVDAMYSAFEQVLRPALACVNIIADVLICDSTAGIDWRYFLARLRYVFDPGGACLVGLQWRCITATCS